MVPVAVSDLFFNLDHSDARKYGGDGNFIGYDENCLIKNAVWFISTLYSVTGQDIGVSPEDLLYDFLGRL